MTIMRSWLSLLQRYQTHLMILAACILAYGLLAPSLGYYWDGWPFVWIPQTYGNPGLVEYFQTNRPVLGWLNQLTSPVIHDSALGWQLFSLTMRWCSGYTFWLLLRRLLPQQAEAALWGALLFVVYPGFSQSSIANIYGFFYIVLSVVLLSLWLHLGVAAHLQKKSGSPFKQAGFLLALALGAYALFATEYFFGLELLRPLLLFAFLPAKSLKQKLLRVLRLWWPFALMLPLYAYWRVALIGFQNYDPLEIAASNPAAQSVVEWSVRIVGDVFLGGLAAWVVPFGKFLQADWASRFAWAAAALALAAAVACYGLVRQKPAEGGLPRTAIPLALVLLALSGLPVWAVNLPLRFSFPNDRLTLPMMAGACLLVLGLGYAFIRRPALRRGLFAVLVGSAIAFQFLTSADYRQDWRYQQSFFWQLVWRVPELMPGTTLIMNELEGLHLTDNSLVAPINWLYAPGEANAQLAYYAAYVPLRLQPGSLLESIEPGHPTHSDYFVAEFSGTTDRSLVLLYSPPACLRVLDPLYDQSYPQLPDGLREVLPLSKPGELIDPDGAVQPARVFGVEPSHETWCYYLQRADLARQQGDWTQVAQLGQRAYALADSPNHASEHLPFIEGYAMTGDLSGAEELTREALRANRFVAPMLCALWQRVGEGSGAGDSDVVINMLALSCP